MREWDIDTRGNFKPWLIHRCSKSFSSIQISSQRNLQYHFPDDICPICNTEIPAIIKLAFKLEIV